MNLKRNELNSCCLMGNVEKLNELIDEGVDFHYSCEMPLKNAVANGHFEVVKILVENGADVTSLCGEELRMTRDEGHYEMVNYLIENGADINDERMVNGFTLENFAEKK